jgi:chorismate mutase
MNDLAARLDELNAEIRAYPTPIARCDEQLAALLEERTRIFDELKNRAGCTPLGLWINDGGFHGA